MFRHIIRPRGRRFFAGFCVCALLLAFLTDSALPASGSSASAGATAAGQADLRNALRDLLREDPDLVLDVLRDNSEVVLDIAQQGSEQRRFRILMAQWRDDLNQPKKPALAGRPAKGPANAPVTIAAFTDFTCLYCQQGEKILNNIYNAYPGKIRIVYKPLPVSGHPGALEAAEFMLAAHMQDKDKSWKLFNDFFDNRDLIVGKGGESYLRSAAAANGLNLQKLLADAKGPAVKKILQEDEQEAKKFKFDGTPCFLVNDIVIRGALQENFFRAAVDLALSAAEKK